MTGKTSAKAQLRRQMRARLAALSADEVARASRELRGALDFPEGAAVALFAGLPTEPDLLPLVAEFPKVTFFLPRVISPAEMSFHQVRDLSELRRGAFGIREPRSGAEPTKLDFILCPGLAFTKTGGRLGQGGGFYDRFLPRHPEALKLGVAFSCQIVKTLELAPHDIAMDQILIAPEAPAGGTGGS